MKSNKLSNAELDVMMALWELGSGSVSDVQKSLVGGANKDYAYTTVATLLKRMEDKQAVSSVKSGRSFVYEPVEKLDDFRKTRLSDIVRQFFDGRPSRLASQFIASNSFSREELEELRKVIDEKIPE